MSVFLRVLGLSACVSWLSACASVSVDQVTPQGARPAAPERIYVQDFVLEDRTARVDREGKALADFQRKFAQRLTLATLERVRKRLGPASALRRDASVTRTPAWLVTGRFLVVNQGSRALRAAVGFGAGGTKVETFVTVQDLSGPEPRVFLQFVTTGGSNAQPGAAVGFIAPNYWLMMLDVVGKGLPGLSADVIRTSRQIVAVLSEYMAHEGFLSAEKVQRAKKLGTWP